MRVVLLRVGVDSGSGGIQGPIFSDGSFDYVPIPDDHDVDSRTYGNTFGRHERVLADYFPSNRHRLIENKSIHFDPEFETFTYGDPTSPKARLRLLQEGDILAFYCGLEGWDYSCQPALYLIGYFEVAIAGRPSALGPRVVRSEFASNFHVIHPTVYSEDFATLVLVKGKSGESRLLNRAVKISTYGVNRRGQRIKILSHKMRDIFGDFGGKVSIQRSPPRWVADEFTSRAVEYLKSLV